MKNVFLTVICLVLAAACVTVFAACNKEDENEDVIDGGWGKAGSPVITDSIQKVFDKATEQLTGVTYTPVAYLASQVVAGTNHCILCKATPVVPDAKTTYSIVYIYEDLEGNAEVTQVLPSEAETLFVDGDIVGGWTEPETPEMTEEAKKALDKACETLTGAVYTPVALLATQVVAGTNYRIICESKPSIPSSERGYVIVTVYADLQGNAEITETFNF